MNIPNFTLARLVLSDLNTKLVQIGERLRNLTNQGVLSSEGGGTGVTSYRLGDLLYGLATGVLAKLTGNTTTTRKFLRQTGDGTNSAAPAWDTLVAGDVPNLPASIITSGQLAAARGGTGIDTSGSTGVARVSAGTWSANAGISHLAGSTSADLRGVLSDETGTGPAVFADGPSMTAINITDGNLKLNAYRFSFFHIRIYNNAGTLQHGIFADYNNPGSASAFATQVTGATATLNNTPTVAAGVDFTAGAGIVSGITHFLALNTAAQVVGSIAIQAVVTYDDTGTNVRCAPVVHSFNVNGTTRNRLTLYFTNSATGAAFGLTTANIGAGTQIGVALFGFIA